MWNVNLLNIELQLFNQFLLSLQPEMRESISLFMSYVHKSVNEVSQQYLASERRYNYTTPKSFLEQITLYQNLLTKKNRELQASIVRLENGLEKLRSTASQVCSCHSINRSGVISTMKVGCTKSPKLTVTRSGAHSDRLLFVHILMLSLHLWCCLLLSHLPSIFFYPVCIMWELSFNVAKVF